MQQLEELNGHTFRGGVATVILLILFFCTVNSSLAQMPVPMMVNYFDTGEFGAISPDGIVYIPSGSFAGNYAIVDNHPDEVYIVDKNGILQHHFSITGFAPSATGITYIPSTEFFAVVDNSLDKVFFSNAMGTVQYQFDAPPGCPNPQGITYISDGPNTGLFAIVDSSSDAVFIVDGAGSLQDSFSTGGFGSTNPTGIQYVSGTENFAVIDDSLDDVLIVDASGILQRQFDVGFVSATNYSVTYEPASGNFPIASANQAEVFFVDGDGDVLTNFSTFLFGSTQPTGITYIPTTQQYAIVDIDTDRVYFVDTDGSNPTSCDINTFSNYPSGIAYLPQSENLAIVDYSADEIFIIDQNCTLISQFDIATYGINVLTATGIASAAGGKGTTAQFDVIDAYRDVVKRIDPALPGRIQSQFSTGGIEYLSPEGITGMAGSTNLAMVDSGRDDVFVTDHRGNLLALFDTAPFSTLPRGIAFDSDTGRLAIVDSNSDLVTILDLPGLFLLPELCACDLNNDGKCNILDYQMFIQDWGCTDCP